MPSAEVTAWKADRRLAAWLAERRKKDAARRLGTIRRAHRDLDWVIERRKAQIAATRRDAKNDKERKAAFEAASRERRAELAVAIPADPPRRPGPAPASSAAPATETPPRKGGRRLPEAADPVAAQPAAASSSERASTTLARRRRHPHDRRRSLLETLLASLRTPNAKA